MTAPRDDIPAGLPARANRRVTVALHPFNPDSAKTGLAPSGATIASIVDREVVDPILRAHLVASLNGVEIDRAGWGSVLVNEGDYLLLRVRPSGDSGEKVLRTVLQLAVIAVASWVGAGAGGMIASSFWAAAAAATVMVVGNLAINALVPPPQPDFGQSELPSPTYSVDGARNQALPYRPMPVLFGEHRVYPPLQGAPVQEIVGDDIYLRYLLNLGPMPLEYDAADIKIGETAITEYEGVEYEIRAKDTDPPITLYRDDPYTESVGTLLDGAGWVSRTSQTDTTELLCVYSFPQGLGQVDDQGRNKALSAQLEMRYRPAGSSDAWVYARPTAPQGNTAATAGGRDRLNWFVAEPDLENWTSNLPGGTQSGTHTETRSEPGKPFRVVLRAAVPKGQYDVEVRRVDSAAGDGKQKFDRVEWAALRSISARDPMPLDGYAYMAVYVKASDQLSGVVDVINLVPKRVAPRLSSAIADAADPDLSLVTASDWTSETATRNVADNVLFLYRGGHTQRPLADSRIDWPAWAAFWIWCRDNGFNVDYVIDTPMTRAKAAQMMCATARARPIWVNGKLSVVIDGLRTDGERQLFTPRSTRGFRIRKSFPGEVHALRITFTNRDEGYREDEMLVFADGYSADGSEPGTVAATYYEAFRVPGVTDPDTVWKNGRFWLYTAILQTETVEFEVDVESVASRGGDLVAVAHDVMLVGLGSGRVKSLTMDGAGDVTAITLDEVGDTSNGQLVMETGKTYGIRWRHVEETRTGSGSYQVSVAESLAVSTVPGAVTSLTLPSPVDPADAPKVGDLVAFGETGKETAPILIKRIRPGRNFDARIEGVAYAPGRHTADSGTVPDFDTRITLPRAPKPPQPQLAESFVTDDGIFVRFDVPEAFAENLTGFQVRWRQTPESGSTARFERLPDLRSDERVAQLPPGVPGRSFDIEIRTIGPDGRASDPLLVTELSAANAVSQPAGVTVSPATFTGPGGAKIPGLSVVWTAVPDPRIPELLVYAKAQGAAASEYVVAAVKPAATGSAEIRDLVPGKAYDIGLALRDERQAVSAPLVESLNVTVPDDLVSSDAVIPSASLDATRNAINTAQGRADATIEEAAGALAESASTSLQDSLLNWIEDPTGSDGWLADDGGFIVGKTTGFRAFWPTLDSGEQTTKVLWFPNRKNVQPGVLVQAGVEVTVEDATTSLALEAVWYDSAGDVLSTDELDSAASGRLSGIEAAPASAAAVQFRLVPTASSAAKGGLTVSEPLAAFARPDQVAADAYQDPQSEVISRILNIERSLGAMAGSVRQQLTENRRARAVITTTYATQLGQDDAIAAAKTEVLTTVSDTYVTSAYANSTFQTASQVNSSIASYEFAVGATTDTISGHVNTTAGAVADLETGAAYWETVVEASGSNPALIGIYAGKDGSLVNLAGDALYFFTTVGGTSIKAMEVVSGDVRISNDLYVDNELIMDAAGAMRGGASDYLTGTGFFLGYSGGAYKLGVGDPSGHHMGWDGSALTMTGDIAIAFGASGAINIGDLGGGRSGFEILNASGVEAFYADDTGALRLNGDALPTTRSPTEPVSPAPGEWWFDTGNDINYRWNGVTWDNWGTIGGTWGDNIGGIPANLSSLTGSEGIENGLISIGADGALAGAGGGSVTISGLGFVGDLNANYITNTNELTDGAGLGSSAVWGSVSSRPANLAALGGSEGILNSAISVSDANTSNLLRYSGGAEFTGATNANYITNTNELTDGAGLGNTAAWGSVSGRPTELTDGRIGTGLDASGILQTSVPSASQIPTLLLSKISDAGALAAKSTVGDSELAAGKALVDTNAGTPTPTSVRLVVDTTNKVAMLDDGTNLLRMSPVATEDTGGAQTIGALASDFYEVVAVVQLDDCDGNTLIGIAGSEINYASPDNASAATVDGQWAVIVSSSMTAEGSTINGTPGVNQVLYAGATDGLQYADDAGDIVESSSDFDANQAPKYADPVEVSAGSGTVYVHLGLRVNGSGSIYASGCKLRVPRNS